MVWEFRVFAPDACARLQYLPEVAACVVASVECRTDRYVVAEGFGQLSNLKLRGGRFVELKQRVQTDGQLQLWRKTLAQALELPAHEARGLAKLLTAEGRVPVRPVRDAEELVRFVRDVGFRDARLVDVSKEVRRGLTPQGLAVQVIHLDGPQGRSETVCVEGPLERLRVWRDQVELPDDLEVGSFADYLRG